MKSNLIVVAGCLALTSVFAGPALAQPKSAAALTKSILKAGVPAQALSQLDKFLYENRGRSFQQETYSCSGSDENSVRPCDESKRHRSSKTVTLANPQYVAIIDYSAPSTKKRFFLINRVSGEVQTYLATHGIGSGRTNTPYRFSNIKDSRQTSLGFYLTGEIYHGSYGKTLRMYGLQRSNDQAYNRDIVMHGAWYANEDFISSINPKTGQSFGRLGLSWGCPAMAPSIAERVIPLLQGGSVIFHYHNELLDDAMTGREVVTRPATASPQSINKY